MLANGRPFSELRVINLVIGPGVDHTLTPARISDS